MTPRTYLRLTLWLSLVLAALAVARESGEAMVGLIGLAFLLLMRWFPASPAH